MEYIFRFLFGFLVTFVGCMIAIRIMNRHIRANCVKLKELKVALTKPESYIWVNAEDRLPEHDGVYLVEYSFTEYPLSRCYIVLKFLVNDGRFQNISPRDQKVRRWAELPK